MIRKLMGLLLLVTGLPAVAADLSYNFVEVGYQKIEFDEEFSPGIDIDGEGYGIGASFEIGESWFVGVNYAKAEFDFGIDLDQTSLGVGWHTDISANADFFGTLSYVRAEASAEGLDSIDDDGYGMAIGVRGMVGSKFELAGSLGYVDFGDGGDGTAVGGNALYYFTDNFAAGFTVDIDEDITAYGLGLRVYW
jgi:hypothetical protein